MPRTLSPAAAASALARETAEVWLVCATISGPELDTLRIVNDTVPLVRTAGTFRPYPFEVPLPEDTKEWGGAIEMRVDNIDRRVARMLRDYPHIATVTFEVVLASQPNTVERGPFTFEILQAVPGELALTLSLGYAEGFHDQTVPGQTYTPQNSPGLFV